MKWSILYRGSLSSCNYACDYCPFAKTRNTREELRRDAAELDRFTQWVGSRKEQIGVLFTPWGEALVHRSYQRAMTVLSHLPNVWRVAAQTNLSGRLDWLRDTDREKLALWTTWHPTQVTMDGFLRQCERLDALGIRYSVGTVGTREAFSQIEELRARLPRSVYMWVNAWKRVANYYGDEDLARMQRVDPHFRINALRHPSRGFACRAGETAFSVDGQGTARRCHFIPNVLGNIYHDGFERALQPRLCTNETCGCHIGYVHLEPLNLYSVFGDGVLERIPSDYVSA
jgi:MoaA/NifB/PqqE/SkfB family radical SAM enzyme